MNLSKLFSRSTFLLLVSVFLVSCDGGSNVTSGVDATGQSEVEGAVEDGATNVVEDEEIAQAEDATPLDENTVEDDISQEEENVTTEEVADETDQLLGQTVTIRSDALETVEPYTFTVADQELFGGENIVVVNATGEVFDLPEDDTEVQVTGEVTKFDAADIDSNYDLGLNPDLYTEYSDRPAIIAESLAPAPDPGEIAKDPTQYYGQILAVRGEVEDVYDPNTFTLDEDKLFGGKDLLVVVPNSISSPNATDSTVVIEDGETVAVTGVLRAFTVAELEKDHDLTWDLDVQEQVEAEYSQRPVLVVDKIYPSAIPEGAK